MEVKAAPGLCGECLDSHNSHLKESLTVCVLCPDGCVIGTGHSRKWGYDIE